MQVTGPSSFTKMPELQTRLVRGLLKGPEAKDAPDFEMKRIDDFPPLNEKDPGEFKNDSLMKITVLKKENKVTNDIHKIAER